MYPSQTSGEATPNKLASQSDGVNIMISRKQHKWKLLSRIQKKHICTFCGIIRQTVKTKSGVPFTQYSTSNSFTTLAPPCRFIDNTQLALPL